MTTCLVVVGGEPTTQLVPGDLVPGPGSEPPVNRVIAADSGLDLAHRLGLRADVVVGDLDSVTPESLATAVGYGAEIDLHPEDKDATDLELALRRATADGATRIVAIGGAGGRLDHLLANVSALTAPALAGVEVEAWIGVSVVRVVRDRAALAGAPDLTVSLIAWHGAAEEVSTEGLAWALSGARLEPGESRGVSNRFVGDRAVVSVGCGVVVAVIPDASAVAGVRAVPVARSGADRADETAVSR